MVELEDRILLETGISIIDSEEASRRIFLNGDIPDHFVVDADEDELENYKKKYRVDLSVHDEDLAPPAPRKNPTQEEVDGLLSDIALSSRMISGVEYQTRIDEELEWFEKSNNMHVLVNVNNLLKRFREDGTIWGVGRGSSCASLTFYLLGVHDIDPVKYDIPFYEMSKEM